MEPTAPAWRSLDAERAADRSTDPPGPARRAVLLAALGVVAIAVLAGAAVLLVVSGPRPALDVRSAAAAGGATPTGSSARAGGAGARLLVVEVAGAVVHPGVYRLPDGSRVGDAIAAAGGYGPRVDPAGVDASLNLAAKVADGDRIRVPSRDDAASAGPAGSAAGGAAASGQAGPIDLNSASAAALDTLPGIGPVTAEKIIASRTSERFRSIDDLLARKLVSASTFEKLKALVTVR